MVLTGSKHSACGHHWNLKYSYNSYNTTTKKRNWRCSSVVVCLSSLLQALGSMSSTEKEEEEKKDTI
jgi:hypothetical protein